MSNFSTNWLHDPLTSSGAIKNLEKLTNLITFAVSHDNSICQPVFGHKLKKNVTKYKQSAMSLP